MLNQLYHTYPTRTRVVHRSPKPKINDTLKDKQAIYRGVNTVISTGHGENFELQFHTEESFDVKQKDHSLYELFRLSATPESEKEELARQMVENSSAIKTPSEVEMIGGID